MKFDIMTEQQWIKRHIILELDYLDNIYDFLLNMIKNNDNIEITFENTLKNKIILSNKYGTYKFHDLYNVFKYFDIKELSDCIKKEVAREMIEKIRKQNNYDLWYNLIDIKNIIIDNGYNDTYIQVDLSDTDLNISDIEHELLIDIAKFY